MLDEGMGQRILRLFEERKRRELADGVRFERSDLAAEMGVPLHELTSWIKGRAEPDADQVVRLAKVLDVSKQYIRSGESGRRVDFRGLSGPQLGDQSNWVFWTMGQLVWQLQIVEQAVAETGVALFDGYRGMGIDKAEAKLARRGRETLGKRIQRIKNRLSLSEETARLLGDLVKERNWFIHESHREHGPDIRSDRSVAKLMDRLDRLSKLTNQVLAGLREAIGEHVLAHGIDPRQVEQETRQRLSL